ncbi:trypsin-like serine protease, partial [Streptomyces nojiriensis]|uniref:trypsin-like serine protease n=1 Tax=Streptomyces nojiriensis TaxID=66374 RepID=UPI0036585C85
SVKDQTQSLDVASNTSKGFGEAGTDPSAAVLLELRVTGTSAAAPQAPAGGDHPLAFTGKLNIGDSKRFCTATLVDPRWVLTAKSCFADKPTENNTVAAGAPKEKTTVTVGRTDLATSGGHTTEIVELVPREDRDLVMARLDKPAFSVPPAAVSATAPAAGQELTVAGFGRTATEWAPSKIHTAGFTVGTVAATGIDLAAKTPADATVCKGDAGAPTLRTENGKTAVVAIGSRSWQGGCLDSSETKTGAYGTRVDDLGKWIADIARGEVKGDVNGDGRTDAIMTYHHGDGSIGFYSSLTDNTGHLGEFNIGYKVSAGDGWDRNSMRLIPGDFNGDHRTDLAMMYRHTNGAITLNTGLANTQGLIQPFTPSTYTIPSNAGWDWNAIQLMPGDVNGDGRTDAIMTYHHGDGSIGFYSSLTDNTGHLGEFNIGYKVSAGDGWDRNSMRLIPGDFNGDHRTDLAMMYRHTNGAITLNTGLANTQGLIQPFTPSTYTIPSNAGWDWNAIQLMP